MNFVRIANIGFTIAAIMGIGAASAHAEETVTFLYQPVGGFTNAFVAADNGFFKQHGLEVKFQASQLASNVLAIVESGQVEIAGPTMLPILQANESGLDLVVIAGASVYPLPGDGLVAGTGSGIEHSQDLKGKTVGVPGIGTQLYAVLRWGLERSHVDPNSVKYVELGFLQASDALKSRQIDAYTAVGPFTERIEKAGNGKLLDDWPELPDGTTTVVYTTTRKWAEAHRQTVEAFRAALREADAFIHQDKSATFPIVAHYTNLPLNVVETMPVSDFTTDLSDKQIQFWIDLAKDQKLINGTPDPKSILFK